MRYSLENRAARATVHRSGGMVLAEFTLGDRRVRPLFLPAWASENAADGLLNNLRGDFPCVPFGGAPAQAALPGGWHPDKAAADPDEFAHGYGAHHLWNLAETGVGFIRIAVDYPRSHPIEGLERIVSLSPDHPKVLFEDRIHVRKTCRLPVGLHPIFRLPKENGAARLRLPNCRIMRTYPGDVDASAAFVPDASVPDAQAVPLRRGGTADATSLPMEISTEDLLMLCEVETGRVALENRAEAYRAVLEWDASLLKGCLLWFSNRGRGFEPWNGRNVCLGVEPIASAFDLGTAVSLGGTPLGAFTGLSMKAGDTVVLKHSISVEEFP